MTELNLKTLENQYFIFQYLGNDPSSLLFKARLRREKTDTAQAKAEKSSVDMNKHLPVPVLMDRDIFTTRLIGTCPSVLKPINPITKSIIR